MGRTRWRKSRNAFAAAKSMGHVDLKSIEPYQHRELEPLREAINQRSQRKNLVRFLVRLSIMTQNRASRFGTQFGPIDLRNIEHITII
jgi:hypothetical protein